MRSIGKCIFSCKVISYNKIYVINKCPINSEIHAINKVNDAKRNLSTLLSNAELWRGFTVTLHCSKGCGFKSRRIANFFFIWICTYMSFDNVPSIIRHTVKHQCRHTQLDVWWVTTGSNQIVVSKCIYLVTKPGYPGTSQYPTSLHFPLLCYSTSQYYW